MMPIKKISKKLFGLLVALGLVVAFLIFVLISLARQETTLKLVTSYELPKLPDVSKISDLGYQNYAVAVDGVTVAGDNLVAPELRPTASTAKMILGLAIMKVKPFNLGEQGEIITINEEDYNRYIWYVNNGGSNTAVRIGEEISEYDALMSVFLPSSNNMADTLATWAFGSQENYREYATAMLREWGIVDTIIGEDASGFDASTVSTANDLARIGQKILENSVLAEIVGTRNYEVPIAGMLSNTNRILGKSGVSGIKTGFIGDASGYCLVSGYLTEGHIITIVLLGAESREASFNESLEIINTTQETLQNTLLIQEGQVIGYYDSWWTGKVPIRAQKSVYGLGWVGADAQIELDASGEVFKIWLGAKEYEVPVEVASHETTPSSGERLAHVFGWRNEHEIENDNNNSTSKVDTSVDIESEMNSIDNPNDGAPQNNSIVEELTAVTNVTSDNCTIKYGYLMLINPNFTVDTDFIDARREELVSLYDNYGIVEGNPYNGDNLLDAEAATHLNEMNQAYAADYPGHAFETRSCYRARGTTCGRLCAATGASDHHTGLTCDLLDPDYGTSLDTDTYGQHLEWQWLRANSYKYGFIDRFPEAWAGGPMWEPLNVDENGSTGLFETWHYRYVGVNAATEIATGKYNNGEYDSLEHYLKALGLVSDLKYAKCE